MACGQEIRLKNLVLLLTSSVEYQAVFANVLFFYDIVECQTLCRQMKFRVLRGMSLIALCANRNTTRLWSSKYEASRNILNL